jgi:hypothetical protein
VAAKLATSQPGVMRMNPSFGMYLEKWPSRSGHLYATFLPPMISEMDWSVHADMNTLCENALTEYSYSEFIPRQIIVQ